MGGVSDCLKSFCKVLVTLFLPHIFFNNKLGSIVKISFHFLKWVIDNSREMRLPREHILPQSVDHASIC